MSKISETVLLAGVLAVLLSYEAHAEDIFDDIEISGWSTSLLATGPGEPGP